MRTCGECIGQRAMCCDYATYLALLIEDEEGLRRVLGSAVFLTRVCLTEIIACQPEPVEGQVKANASESRTLCMSRARGRWALTYYYRRTADSSDRIQVLYQDSARPTQMPTQLVESIIQSDSMASDH